MRAALLLLVCLAPLRAAPPVDPIGEAFHRMYDLDFAAAHRILDDYDAKHPSDAFAVSVRAAAYLFYELDRLKILEGEFLTDDKRIAAKEKLVPDPKIREQFFATIDRSQRLAAEKLKTDPDDLQTLFSFCLTEGMRMDYLALVEKKQLGSLSYAKKAHNYALQVIRKDPNFVDAYLTTGITEYLVGSLPFFVRWFVRFEQVEGSKDQAVSRLTRVAGQGRYLGPFAKILLSIIHVREKRPEKAVPLLTELSQNYPRNQLYRNELAKISSKIKRR